MAEDRMLRAAMRESERVNSWPIPLRFFWTQLWGYCDSYGRGRRDPRLVLAGTFPLDEEVDTKMIDRWMIALEKQEVIAVYEVAGKRYFECVNWDEHQDIRYRKKTDVPDRQGVIPGISKNSKTFQNVSHQVEGEVEGEEEREGESAPSPFCKKHPTGTDKPCAPCGDARRRHTASTPTPKPTVSGIVTAPQCKEHGYPFPCPYGCTK